MKGKGTNITIDYGNYFAMCITSSYYIILLHHHHQILSQDPDFGSSSASTAYELCDLGRVT